MVCFRLKHLFVDRLSNCFCQQPENRVQQQTDSSNCCINKIAAVAFSSAAANRKKYPTFIDDLFVLQKERYNSMTNTRRDNRGTPCSRIIWWQWSAFLLCDLLKERRPTIAHFPIDIGYVPENSDPAAFRCDQLIERDAPNNRPLLHQHWLFGETLDSVLDCDQLTEANGWPIIAHFFVNTSYLPIIKAS